MKYAHEDCQKNYQFPREHVLGGYGMVVSLTSSTHGFLKQRVGFDKKQIEIIFHKNCRSGPFKSQDIYKKQDSKICFSKTYFRKIIPKTLRCSKSILDSVNIIAKS